MSEPGGGGGEDGSAGLEVSAVQNVADVSVLQKHLRKLVPLLLEDGGEAPAALEAALEEKSALEQMRKFLSDPQVHTVLVERSTLKGAGPGVGALGGRGGGAGEPGGSGGRSGLPAAGALRDGSPRPPGEARATPPVRREPRGCPLLGRGERRAGAPVLSSPKTMGSLCLLGPQDGRVGWRQRLRG